MESPAPVRGVRWLIAVVFVSLLVGCSSDPESTGTPEAQTSTTLRRTPRTTTSTTAAPRRRPSIVVPDPGPVAETPAPDPATGDRSNKTAQGDAPAAATEPSPTDPPLTFYYASCAAAYAAGAAPLYYGFEGYWDALDPDGDGVACDPPLTFYYADCDSARAAGAAPLYYGYEGYWEALDPDGDGVACD